MKHARIEIVPVDVGREGGQTFAFDPHYLRLVASNGPTLAHSENYSTRSKARRAVGAWTDAFADVLNGWHSLDVVVEVTWE